MPSLISQRRVTAWRLVALLQAFFFLSVRLLSGLAPSELPAREPSTSGGARGGTSPFGDPAKLDLPQFTLETWFKRTGTACVASTWTGTGGITNFVPLLTHGAALGRAGSNVDANWVRGINTSGNVTLAADFEAIDDPADPTTGQNCSDQRRNRHHQQRVASRRRHLRWHHLVPSTSTATWRGSRHPRPAPALRLDPQGRRRWAPCSCPPAPSLQLPVGSRGCLTRRGSGASAARRRRSRPPRTPSSPRAPTSSPAGASTKLPERWWVTPSPPRPTARSPAPAPPGRRASMPTTLRWPPPIYTATPQSTAKVLKLRRASLRTTPIPNPIC